MKKQNDLARRNFLQQLGITASTAMLPLPFYSSCVASGKKSQPPLIFGIMADAHADLIPDKNERIEKFIREAISKEVDFIIQLGDFCFP